MLKNYFFWASVLLLGVNLFFGFRLKESVQIAEVNSAAFSSKENYLIGNINNASFLQSLGLRLNGEIIPNVELTSEFSKKINLSEVVNGKKLIFNFRETDCDICLEQQLTVIKALPKEVLKDVLMIGSFSHVRDMRTYKRTNKLDLPMYMTETPLLEMAEGHGIPAMFIVDGNRSIIQAFFPIKEITGLSDSFYATFTRLLGNPK